MKQKKIDAFMILCCVDDTFFLEKGVRQRVESADFQEKFCMMYPRGAQAVRREGRIGIFASPL